MAAADRKNPRRRDAFASVAPELRAVIERYPDRLDSSRGKPLPQSFLAISKPANHLQNTSIVTSSNGRPLRPLWHRRRTARRRFLPKLAVSADLLDDLGLAPLNEGDLCKSHIIYL